jgi:RNA polymerase sigma-70 factor (ECF subfamily)
MSETDAELIEDYLAGDLAAFERLYERHAVRLLGFARSLGAPQDGAEDIAQAAWMKALRGLKRYRDRGMFRQWLFKIAFHTWVNESKSAWERGRTDAARMQPNDEGEPADMDVFADRAEGPRAVASANELRGRIEQALAILPDEMRQALLLRADGELTYREIAESLGCPLGTVLWRVREAQSRIAKHLEIDIGRFK